ncbi:MAG TPA: type II secretion system F family protein [Vicinamibacterales bacterium]|nr:type II secretion system F family protein [Vicinamibacterales bacterium]
MEFRCRLASPNGEIVEGVYIADNEARLRHEFEEKGLFVLSMQSKGSIAGVSLRLPERRSLNSREFLIFNQELATLLKAGMPLVQSLDLLKGRVTSPLFRRVLEDVHERVRSGSALSDAFAAHGELFPSIYTASLLAGERSGNLDAVLRRFVEYSKIISTLKRKTVSALVYPAILIALAIGLVSLIVLKVVPAFSDFYGSFGADLPLVTKIIVRVSNFIRGQFPFLVIGGVAAVIAIFAWIRQPGQKARFDHLLLGVPMLGEVARKFSTSQMARTLATLLGGGLPLVNALDIASKSIGNQFMAAQVTIVSGRVREGESFARALEARGVFPDVAVKMAEVGESTGALQDMLNTVADFYDEEIATTMERFVTLVEPVLLVVMGVVIAGLLLALYMPLFQLSSVLS